MLQQQTLLAVPWGTHDPVLSVTSALLGSYWERAARGVDGGRYFPLRQTMSIVGGGTPGKLFHDKGRVGSAQ